MKELICPICKSDKIYEEDCYDTMSTNNGYAMLYVGHCENCGQNLQWQKNYKFIGYSNIEID